MDKDIANALDELLSVKDNPLFVDPDYYYEGEFPNSLRDRGEYFRSAIKAWDKAAEDMEAKHNVHPYDILLEKFFKYDQWKVKEAWLLLAGILPVPASIDWDYVVESCEGAELGRIKLEVVYPIKFRALFEHPKERVSEGEMGLSDQSVADWNKEVDKQRFVKEQYRKRLEKIVNLWERTKHSESRFYDPGFLGGDHRSELVDIPYVIDWASSKGIEIDWFDWANSRGYLNSGTQIQGVKNQRDNKSAPDPLDNKSNSYSEELAIAIQIWSKLQEQEIIRKTPKRAALELLEQNYEYLSEDAKERIAKVVNWNKKGGSPKTY